MSASSEHSHGRGIVFRLGAVLLGLVAGLVLAEAALRIFNLHPGLIVSKRLLIPTRAGDPVSYHCYSSNPHGEFSPPPDLSTGRWKLMTYAKRELPLSEIEKTPWCVEYRLARTGMRGQEPSVQPAAGRLRIAVIGDSFVFGEGVPEDRTLVAHMAQQLGDRFDLLNGGYPGAGLEKYVHNAAFFTREFHCTRLMVVFLANDIELTPELASRQNHINDLINFRDLHLQAEQNRIGVLGHSRLVQALDTHWIMANVTQHTIQWYLDSYDPRFNAEHLGEFTADLSRLAATPGCQIVLVLYPLLEQLETGYPLAPIHQRVAAMAREAGLPVLDLAPVFAGTRTRELWVHDCDHHPNGQTHRRAAEAIIAWLRSDVPGFLEGE
jgi:hypothetical protein